MSELLNRTVYDPPLRQKNVTRSDITFNKIFIKEKTGLKRTHSRTIHPSNNALIQKRSAEKFKGVRTEFSKNIANRVSIFPYYKLADKPLLPISFRNKMIKRRALKDTIENENLHQERVSGHKVRHHKRRKKRKKKILNLFSRKSNGHRLLFDDGLNDSISEKKLQNNVSKPLSSSYVPPKSNLFLETGMSAKTENSTYQDRLPNNSTFLSIYGDYYRRSPRPVGVLASNLVENSKSLLNSNINTRFRTIKNFHESTTDQFNNSSKALQNITDTEPSEQNLGNVHSSQYASTPVEGNKNKTKPSDCLEHSNGSMCNKQIFSSRLHNTHLSMKPRASKSMAFMDTKPVNNIRLHRSNLGKNVHKNPLPKIQQVSASKANSSASMQNETMSTIIKPAKYHSSRNFTKLEVANFTQYHGEDDIFQVESEVALSLPMQDSLKMIEPVYSNKNSLLLALPLAFLTTIFILGLTACYCRHKKLFRLQQYNRSYMRQDEDEGGNSQLCQSQQQSIYVYPLQHQPHTLQHKFVQLKQMESSYMNQQPSQQLAASGNSKLAASGNTGEGYCIENINGGDVRRHNKKQWPHTSERHSALFFNGNSVRYELSQDKYKNNHDQEYFYNNKTSRRILKDMQKYEEHYEGEDAEEDIVFCGTICEAFCLPDLSYQKHRELWFSKHSKLLNQHYHHHSNTTFQQLLQSASVNTTSSTSINATSTPSSSTTIASIMNNSASESNISPNECFLKKSDTSSKSTNSKEEQVSPDLRLFEKSKAQLCKGDKGDGSLNHDKLAAEDPFDSCVPSETGGLEAYEVHR